MKKLRKWLTSIFTSILSIQIPSKRYLPDGEGSRSLVGSTAFDLSELAVDNLEVELDRHVVQDVLSGGLVLGGVELVVEADHEHTLVLTNLVTKAGHVNLVGPATIDMCKRPGESSQVKMFHPHL